MSRPDEEPEYVDRWTLADQDDDAFQSAIEIVWDGSGHHGEAWLGPEDGDYVDRHGHRSRKPQPSDAPTICACDWPVPVNWSWSQCEFGGPRAWRSIHPEMEAVLDDDPLLYRVAPWIWTFCRCNGCVALTRGKGRPSKYCSKRCKADADNARDRMRRRAAGAIPRNRTVTEFTAQSA